MGSTTRPRPPKGRRLRQVAQKHGAGYVDATAWLANGYNLFADGTHPSDEGQRQLAHRMEKALHRQLR